MAGLLPSPPHPPARSFHEGWLSTNFSSNYYLLSQRHEDVPRLTPAHLEVGGGGWAPAAPHVGGRR